MYLCEFCKEKSFDSIRKTKAHQYWCSYNPNILQRK